MNWISVEENLPKIGENVLCYYTIGEHEYYCVARIYQITTVQVSEAEYKNIEWKDNNGDCVEPLFWCRLSAPARDGERMTK